MKKQAAVQCLRSASDEVSSDYLIDSSDFMPFFELAITSSGYLLIYSVPS